MVRMAMMAVILVGAALLGLSTFASLESGAMAAAPTQDGHTTLGIQGEALEAVASPSAHAGLVCQTPGADDESQGCAGKTVVSASLPAFPPTVGTSPREVPAPRPASGAIIATDLQPPKAV